MLYPRMSGDVPQSSTSQPSRPEVRLPGLPTKLLVTGATGWLGRRLVGALLSGLDGVPGFETPGAVSELRVLLEPGEALPQGFTHPALKLVRGDLRDANTSAELCADATGAVLFHTAAVIHPRRVQDFYSINTDGGSHLLRAAAAAGVGRAVVVSSNSPLGCNPSPGHRFDEDSPFNPYMGYGRSKMLLEQATTALSQETGLDAVIVRPPWFYGPFQPARQTLFFEMIRDGKAPIVGGGDNPRSMVYIDNLVQGLLRAAQVPEAKGRVYWIADAAPYSMNQVVDTVERLMETEFGYSVRHRRLRLPGLVGDVATWLDAGLQRVGLYQQKLHVLGEMNKTIACRIDRARAELGYEPTIALEEGMRRSLSYCIEQGLLPPPPKNARRKTSADPAVGGSQQPAAPRSDPPRGG